MNSDGIIDFSKLEKELFAAVEEDAKYQRENDAKFRAVEQKVGTYEEFKDIVAASHLRPLDKEDKEGLHNRKQPWNSCAEKQTTNAETKLDNVILVRTATLPKNSHEFQKQWSHLGNKDLQSRYNFLLNIGGLKLAEIFHVEISMGLLGEIIQTLYENKQPNDSQNIYEILIELSNVKRFNLSLQFLSSEERNVLVKLVQLLDKDFVDQPDVINQLRVVYKIENEKIKI